MRCKITIIGCVLGACTASAPDVPSEVTIPNVDRVASGTRDATYPPAFAVLDEATLRRRTVAYEAKTPGWKITLDPLGYLSLATYSACSHDRSLTADDEAHVEAFFATNEELVQVSAPGMTRTASYGGPVFQQIGPVFQQIGPFGVAAFVRVEKDPRVGIRIVGHAFPTLPIAGEAKSDDALERDLKAIDASPNLIVEKGYRRVARTPRGPLELREVACLSGGDLDRVEKPFRPRPCLDARTGENITPYIAAIRVTTTNGHVTQRAIELLP